MSRWVVLLRGVNVGGHRTVPMADLRAALADAGFGDPRTYLQSGNAVVEHDGDEAHVAAAVRQVLADRLDVTCDVMVRSAQDLQAVVDRNPWPDRADRPTLLHVVFLAAAPTGQVQVRGAGPDEQAQVVGREVYVWYGAGAGRSRLSLDAGTPGTARNWRTVSALVDLVAATPCSGPPAAAAR